MYRLRENGYDPSPIVSGRRGDAAVATVDLDRLHALLLGGVERVADPAERRLRALDAVDDQVVVGARRVVGAGRPPPGPAPRRGRRWRTRRTCRRCRSPYRGRRCRAGRRGRRRRRPSRPRWPARWRRTSWRSPPTPVRRRAYRAGTSRQVTAALAGLVATVRPSMAISSSTYSIPFSSQSGDLLLVDRAGGVGDVGVAVAELGEAVAGARALDGDRAARRRTARAASSPTRMRDRLDRRRAGDEHARRRRARSSAARRACRRSAGHAVVPVIASVVSVAAWPSVSAPAGRVGVASGRRSSCRVVVVVVTACGEHEDAGERRRRRPGAAGWRCSRCEAPFVWIAVVSGSCGSRLRRGP